MAKKKKKTTEKRRAGTSEKTRKKSASAHPTEKAGGPVSEDTRKRRSHASRKSRRSSAGITATDTEGNASVNFSSSTQEIALLRACTESLGLTEREGEHQEVPQAAPVPPEHNDHAAMGRLMEKISEIHAVCEHIENEFRAIQQRSLAPEDNQRPPSAATLGREAAARTDSMRWMIAQQCRAAGLVRPTPAIIGRAMDDERAYSREKAASPQELFLTIFNQVKIVFGASSEGEEIDYVHLTEEIVQILEGQSSLPQKKHSDYLNRYLKTRITLLLNSGLAAVEPDQHGRRTNYRRYLTAEGKDVFQGWPEWNDVTGGTSS